MKAIDQIVHDYEKGAVTATGFALEVLRIVTVANLDQTMAVIPTDYIVVLKEFTEGKSLRRAWPGPQPSESAYALVKQWIMQHTT